jgi:hypothetical protein
MSAIKKLIIDEDPLPPAQITIDGISVKQVVNSDTDVL